MTRVSILVLAVATLLVPACSKKGDGGGGDKPAAVTLPKLGVMLDIPGEATPGDGMSGDLSAMITGSEIGAMTVDVPKTPKTLDDAKSDAAMFTPRNLKVDTLPDGFAITFDNTGSMGDNFFVDVQRTIGGKAYSCSTTTNSADRQKAVVAACKSLRVAAAATAPATK